TYQELASDPAYHSTMLVRYLLMAALALAPCAFGEGLPDLGESSQSSFSTLDERKLGDEIMREIRADKTYFDDAEATDYVNALGRRLSEHGPDAHPDLKLFLIQDPQINAFALPGGYIGVNTGLLLAAQSESEVAGVLAHEMAHITQH